MNKNILSAIICAVLAALTIICSVAAGKSAEMPDGKAALNKIIGGCEKMSSSKITPNFSGSAYSVPTFDSCAVTEDYYRACGISFDYMYNEKCTTEKIYIAGANDKTAAGDTMESLNSLLDGAAKYGTSEFYIAADYIDEKGEKRTTAKCFYVLVDEKSGKIVSIYS